MNRILHGDRPRLYDNTSIRLFSQSSLNVLTLSRDYIIITNMSKCCPLVDHQRHPSFNRCFFRVIFAPHNNTFVVAPFWCFGRLLIKHVWEQIFLTLVVFQLGFYLFQERFCAGSYYGKIYLCNNSLGSNAPSP